MRKEVKKGKENKERLLYTYKALEGLFPIELNNSLASGDVLVSDYILVYIVAFRGIGLEKKTIINSLKGLVITIFLLLYSY